MRPRLVVLLSALAVLMPMHVVAQSSPIPGDLTTFPPINLGPTAAVNGGFETIGADGLPTTWTTGSGWSVDRTTLHSGASSLKFSTGAPTASQTIQLKKGVYNISAWIKTNLTASSANGVLLMIDFRPTVQEWYRDADLYGDGRRCSGRSGRLRGVADV